MQTRTRAPTQIICIYLLKNSWKTKPRPVFQAAHNYTGLTGSINSPGLFWYFVWSQPKDTVPSADGHYSDEWAPVNHKNTHLFELLAARPAKGDFCSVFSDFRYWSILPFGLKPALELGRCQQLRVLPVLFQFVRAQIPAEFALQLLQSGDRSLTSKYR